MKQCWASRPAPSADPRKSLLIFDLARAHLTGGSKAAIGERSKIGDPGRTNKVPAAFRSLNEQIIQKPSERQVEGMDVEY